MVTTLSVPKGIFHPSRADADAPQEKSFCVDRNTKHCSDREQHEEMFERSKTGEEEKSTSLGS